MFDFDQWLRAYVAPCFPADAEYEVNQQWRTRFSWPVKDPDRPHRRSVPVVLEFWTQVIDELRGANDARRAEIGEKVVTAVRRSLVNYEELGGADDRHNIEIGTEVLDK